MRAFLATFLGLSAIFLAQGAEAATLFKPASNLGLVGRWNFDEGTSTVAHDLSGNGHHGTLVNMGTVASTTSGWNPGKHGFGLSFNGTNSAVSVGNSATLKPSTTMTVSAWVKPDVGSLNGLREIYRKEDGATRMLLAFQGPAGQCNFGAGTGGCISFGISAGGVYSEFDVGVNAVDYEGKWSLVTMTYDGSNRNFYKDGVFVTSTTTTGAIGTAGSATAYIGALSPSSEVFKGMIDDVRIYSRALSAAEIATMYGASSATRRAASNEGLFGHWTFDEGTSTIAHDFSGNGRNGTLINMSAPATVTSGWSAGKKGSALTFDGLNDYVEVADNLSSIGTGSFTSSLWFKGSNGHDSWKRFLTSGCGAYANGTFIARYVGSGRVAGAVCAGGSAASSFVLATNSSYLDGTWHHVAFVVDRVSGTARIYIDGVSVPVSKNAGGECGTLDGSGLFLDISSCASATALGTMNLRIGATSASVERHNDQLDDVRIYSRALSAAEIRNIYGQSQAVLQSSQANRVTDGLVGYWSLNGKDVNWSTATSFDLSGQGNNGTLNGMSSQASVAEGKVGQGLLFDGGNDSMTAAKPSSLTTTISVCMWAKWVTTGATTATIQVLADNLHSNSPNRGFVMQDRPDQSKKLTFSTSPTGAGVSSTGQVGDGTWKHICGTNDGLTTRLYVNGTLDNSASETPNANYQTTVSFGRWLAGTRYFNGQMDEIRLYNRAISAAEVKQLYLLGK